MRRHYFLLFVVGLINFSYSQSLFQDNAVALGVNFSYGSGFLGGGVSFFDYNKDGWDDLTFTSDAGNNVKFYRNMGGYYVEDFLNINTTTFQHKQVQWVDYDNDNDYDLFLTSDSNNNRLYQNDGNLNFTDVTFTAGLLAAASYNFGASWGDYNNDGYLDIFISFREPTQTQANLLYKNNGDGTFVEVGAAAGIVQFGELSFCSAFFDYNNDGLQDIYIANDKITTRNYLYRNNGDGTFTDISAVSGTDLYMGAMCVTVGDYNNDGWQDLYISNDENTDSAATNGNALLHNNGDGTFTNVSAAKGLMVNSVCWGTVFLDSNLDTDLDIYVVASRDGTGTPSSAFFESTGNGNFIEPITSGIYGNDNHISYANAIGDINNDGLPDIAVVNESNELVNLWQNMTTTSNTWLKVNLQGTISNSDGIGSRIEVFADGKSQYRYTHCGEGYLAQNSASEMIGLGTASSIDYIQVTWLSGLVDRIDNVAVNQTLTIVEGSAPLNIDDNEFNTSFKIHPNPATTFFRVIIQDRSQLEDTSVTLFDTLGKKILKTAVTSSQDKVSIAGLAQGIYFAQLLSNGKRETHRIIIK